MSQSDNCFAEKKRKDREQRCILEIKPLSESETQFSLQFHSRIFLCTLRKLKFDQLFHHLILFCFDIILSQTNLTLNHSQRERKKSSALKIKVSVHTESPKKY